MVADELKWGAVAVVDALGFKGIWKRKPVREVLGELRRLKRNVQDLEVVLPLMPLPALSVLVFSDTVAIVAQASSDSEQSRLDAICAVVVAVASLLAEGASASVPFVYRGAIATGQCLADPDDQLLLGEAVDEAAELMNLADGSFVWLSPNTAIASGTMVEAFLVDFPVPLKDGRRITTKVVDPFAFADDRRGRDVIEDGFRNVMTASSALDVRIKWQNTEALLRHARAVHDGRGSCPIG